MEPVNIKLKYFDSTGKLMSGDIYKTTLGSMNEICEQVRSMALLDELPHMPAAKLLPGTTILVDATAHQDVLFPDEFRLVNCSTATKIYSLGMSRGDLDNFCNEQSQQAIIDYIKKTGRNPPNLPQADAPKIKVGESWWIRFPGSGAKLVSASIVWVANKVVQFATAQGCLTFPINEVDFYDKTKESK